MRKNKILAGALTISLAFGGVMASPEWLNAVGATSAVANAETSGDYEYEVKVYDGTIEITKYIGNGGAVTIPSEINGKKVTSIKEGTFSGCTSLTSVTIPDSVTFISFDAFGRCTSLTEINVDSKNKSYCSVDGVVFSKSKKWLKRYPAGKTATSYAIPNSVTEIETGAFSGCTNLNSITIPNSMTKITTWTFVGCTSLTSVTIPDSVTIIDWEAFRGCTNLTSVTIKNRETNLNGIGIPKGDKVTVYGYRSSTAEAFAKENSNKFVALDGETPVTPPAINPNCTLKNGDPNGDGAVNAADVTAVLKHVVGLQKLTGNAFKNADANGDGEINAADATYILKMVVGLI